MALELYPYACSIESKQKRQDSTLSLSSSSDNKTKLNVSKWVQILLISLAVYAREVIRSVVISSVREGLDC